MVDEWWNCIEDALKKVVERFDELVESLNYDTSHEEVKKFNKLLKEFIARDRNNQTKLMVGWNACMVTTLLQ